MVKEVKALQAIGRLSEHFGTLQRILDKNREHSYNARLTMSRGDLLEILNPIIMAPTMSMEERIHGGSIIRPANFAEAIEIVNGMAMKVKDVPETEGSFDAMVSPLENLLTDIEIVRDYEAEQSKKAMDQISRES